RARLRAGRLALKREGLAFEAVVRLSARPASQRVGAATGEIGGRAARSHRLESRRPPGTAPAWSQIPHSYFGGSAQQPVGATYATADGEAVSTSSIRRSRKCRWLQSLRNRSEELSRQPSETS